MAIIQRPVRSRPIRLFLISVFAVPLVSLVALWAFATSITVPAAIADHNYNVSTTALDSSAVSIVTYELPTERAQTYLWLLSNRTTSNAALLATRKIVDQSLPAAEIALQSEDGLLSPASKAVLHTLLTDLQGLGSLRQSVDDGSLAPIAAFQAYSNIIDAQFQSYYTGTQSRDAVDAAGSVGALQSAYSLEMASREVAVADGALTVTHDRMTAAARALFTTSAGQRQTLLNESLGLLSGPYLAGFTTVVNSPMYQQFTAMEQQIETTPDNQPISVDAKAWESVSGQYLQVMQATQAANGPRLAAQSSAATSRLFTEAILAGGLGFIAVLVSIFLLVRFGRQVTWDLTKLYVSVRTMAEVGLPRVVDRLRRGEDVDVQAESPDPPTSNIREISVIAQSFGTVQEAAVAAAVDQARLRKGVNQVFLNISMRNQSLLHRQLGMLDTMERRTSDPAALADLFRLDHLTTRMRRHAEGLIILSGSTPGRGWREPVPALDVLRAAIAEVEDYVRVDVLSESRDLVAGNAVNDVIHLVAELVENAAAFSPPNTRIEVRADRAGTGLVVEIEDRGLGLSDEELADINERLARPPEFDLANSEQLGLFVVSRLAVRQNIKVALRQSVYGGTTAILVMPFGVIVRDEDARDGSWQDEDGAALPPAAGKPGPATSEPPSPAPGRRGGPPLDIAGRHRLPSAATGRRAETSDPTMQPWELANVAPWPEAWRRESVAGERAQPTLLGRREGGGPATPAGSTRDREPASPPSSGSHLGMPIRVPQASLAPELRGRGDAKAPALVHPGPDIDERPPETIRNVMTEMQQGWQRGRVDDLDDPDGAPTMELTDSEAENGTD